MYTEFVTVSENNVKLRFGFWWKLGFDFIRVKIVCVVVDDDDDDIAVCKWILGWIILCFASLFSFRD